MLEQSTPTCRLVVRREISSVRFLFLDCFFTSCILLNESFGNGFVIINFEVIALPKVDNCIDGDGWVCTKG